MKRFIAPCVAALVAFALGATTAVASPQLTVSSQVTQKQQASDAAADQLDAAAKRSTLTVNRTQQQLAAQWRWADQGRTISNSASSVVYKGNLYVFVRRPDGHLWVNWWNGSSWSWADQGRTITGTPHAVVYSGNLYVFVRRPGGHLWVNWWNGSSWSWADQGRTITDTPNAVVYSGNLYVFVRRPGGRLWVNWWNGSSWSWADQEIGRAHV